MVLGCRIHRRVLGFELRADFRGLGSRIEGFVPWDLGFGVKDVFPFYLRLCNCLSFSLMLFKFYLRSLHPSHNRQHKELHPNPWNLLVLQGSGGTKCRQ